MALRLLSDRRLSNRLLPDRQFPDLKQLPRPTIKQLPQPTFYALVGVSVGRGNLDLYDLFGEPYISMNWSGNMPISMLWSVIVSRRGTDGRTIDGRTKDVVPLQI